MHSAVALNLKAAEVLALERADEVRQYQDLSDAFEARAIASSQLADPTINVGALNFPVDTFKLSQEPMTQLQAGISQAIPKGFSLKYQYLSLHQQAAAVLAQSRLQELLILKQVRQLWFELYGWEKSELILCQQLKIFNHLQQVAGSLYANNKVPQKDVLNAQLEVGLIKERIITVQQALNNTKLTLARWIGEQAANKARYSNDKLAQLNKTSIIKRSLIHHPRLNIDKANIAQAQAQLKLAREDYKPGFNAGIAYGYRQGKNNDGTNRPDFVTGTLSVSMPLFPKNRQDKKVLAATKQLSSLKEKYQLDYKEMKKLLKMSVNDYSKTRQQIKLYQTTLLSQAKQYADSSLVAYQNNRADFISVAQSHVRQFDIELAKVKLAVNLNIIHSNLLYLQGIHAYEK